MEQYYAISEVARRLDTAVSAVRYYSERCSDIPDRRLITAKQKMRMYTEQDIEILRDKLSGDGRG